MRETYDELGHTGYHGRGEDVDLLHSETSEAQTFEFGSRKESQL